MEQIYTVEDIAGFWQVEPEIVQAHVDAGRLKGINIGIDELHVRFHADDIAKCLESLRGSRGVGSSAVSPTRTRLPLPGVYRLNIKSEANPGIDPKEFCLDEGVAGMGWPVEPDSTALDWDQYRQLAAETYPDGSWWRPVTTLRDAPDHSVIWTRRGNGRDTRFYLGLVVGPWKYRNDDQAREADIVNIRPVIWHEVGGYDVVPDSIANAFTPITYAPIRQPEAVGFTEALAAQLVSDGIWEEISLAGR